MSRTKLLVASLGCFAAALLLSAVAWAQGVPNPDTDLGGFLGFVVSAFQAHQWGLAAAAVVMLVVWVVGKLLKPDNRWLPLVSAGVAVLMGIVTGIAGGVVWYEALFNGLLVGTAASGFWSLVGKHIFGPKK